MRRPATRYHAGRAAEDAAARSYEAEGGRIAARRWRSPAGEIDLIVRFPDRVVFVEVKARRSHDEAAAAISAAQVRRIGGAALLWLAENGTPDLDCRFDAVLVDGQGHCLRRENAASFEGF